MKNANMENIKLQLSNLINSFDDPHQKKVVEGIAWAPMACRDDKQKIAELKYKEQLIKILLKAKDNSKLWERIIKLFSPNHPAHIRKDFLPDNLSYYFGIIEELLDNHDDTRLSCILYLLTESSSAINDCDTRDYSKVGFLDRLYEKTPQYDPELLQKHHERERALIDNAKDTHSTELLQAISTFYYQLEEKLNSPHYSDVASIVPYWLLIELFSNAFLDDDNEHRVSVFLDSFFDTLDLTNGKSIRLHQMKLECYVMLTRLSSWQKREYANAVTDAQPPVMFADKLVSVIGDSQNNTTLFNLDLLRKLENDTRKHYFLKGKIGFIDYELYFPIVGHTSNSIIPFAFEVHPCGKLSKTLKNEEFYACLAFNGYYYVPADDTLLYVPLGMRIKESFFSEDSPQQLVCYPGFDSTEMLKTLTRRIGVGRK